MKLNPEQRSAVKRSGQDVCVVAGPGSGKTRVLVERFRRSVDEGVLPSRLLAVTFTEKAANELKERLARECKDRAGMREQIARAPVHTLHGFCAGLLREHAITAGIDPEFSVLDPDEAAAILENCAEEALDSLLEEQPGKMRALLGVLDTLDPISDLVRVYESVRMTATGFKMTDPALPGDAFESLREQLQYVTTGDAKEWNANQQAALADVKRWAHRVLALDASTITAGHFEVLSEFGCDLRSLRRGNLVYKAVQWVKQELLEAARAELAAEYYKPQRALLWHVIERLHEIYRARKEARGALDFDDLEELAVRLLRDNAPVRERVRGSFDEILMDELQDTNPLQATLVSLIRRPKRFFAVGDINQSIYGFRNADPDVFREYRDEIAANSQCVDELCMNYRSRREILAAAEAVAEGAEGIEPRELIASRDFARKNEPSVEVIAAIGESSEEAAEAEAAAVARRIRELEGTLIIREKESGTDRPTAFRDMVILVRNVNALAPFESALQRAGIPYQIGRGKHFFEAREITDLVHLLRVIVNARDEISMVAVLRSPLVSVSNETLFRLRQIGNLGEAVSLVVESNAGTVEFGGFDAGDLGRLRKFAAWLADARTAADDVSPECLLMSAMDATGYESALGLRERANVTKLLARLREFFNSEPRPLGRIVEELELLRAADPDETSAPSGESANAVHILTAHSAKGLEFPVVFLAALHKGVRRDLPAIAFAPSSGLAVRWFDPASGKQLLDSYYGAFKAERERRAAQEENRLLYVAITRAEEHLVLSFAKGGKAPERWAAKVLKGLDVKITDQDVGVRVQRRGAQSGFDIRVWTVNSDDPFGASEPLETAEMPNGEEELLERPAVDGQHDGSAAVTSIGLYAACPRRYYLARYLGIEAPPARPVSSEIDDDAISASELGRQVHGLLAAERVPDASQLALDLAARFQLGELGKRAALAEELEREFDFMMAVDDVVVEGRIDLWFRDAEELVVVDYKTDDVSVAEAARRAESYSLQLRLYALALERYTGSLPARAVLSFLRPEVDVEVSLEAGELAAALDCVREFRRAQASLDFPPAPGERCGNCPYCRGLCPI